MSMVSPFHLLCFYSIKNQQKSKQILPICRQKPLMHCIGGFLSFQDQAFLAAIRAWAS